MSSPSRSPLHAEVAPKLTHGSKRASFVSSIEALIEQYSVGLDPLPVAATPSATFQGPLVVLLTGSTGSLGSEILSKLLENDRVAHVYAFNRPSNRGDTIEERQMKPFRERGLNTDLLRSPKLSYILGDATQPDLGIERDQYNLLRKEVNILIHNAWQVSFASRLSVFVPHIQATRHMVDFLRAGPHAAHARFFFSSSITSALGWPLSKGPYPEEIVTDASAGAGMGYGASKYIAERASFSSRHLSHYILAKSGLKMTTFRIGQLYGPASARGIWDATEWLPIFLKTCIALGCYPDVKGMLDGRLNDYFYQFITWVPMDIAAAAIVEAALVAETLPQAVNLVNPRPTDNGLLNEYLISTTKKLLGKHLDLVSMKRWLSMVEERSIGAGADTLREIPAISLLPYFREMSKSVDRMLDSKILSEIQFPNYANDKMCRISPNAMKELQPLQKSEVEMWFRYWQEINFLGNARSRL
ncbi:hypothetical protein H0H93_001393 [Arthromyces matolae]|nr:hypothetical protein H0H93_001393 [Arthromyces matolae]